jgi:hypothetical protein
MSDTEEVITKPKRGRPKKSTLESNKLKANANKNPSDPPKKRGRKPKGGKIVPQNILIVNEPVIKPSIILHLKCSIHDLNLNNIHNGPNPNTDTDTFNFSVPQNELKYEVINKKPEDISSELLPKENGIKNNEKDNIKNIWKKLKQLDNDLHFNTITNNNSACFWCTCDFNSHTIYIPSHFVKESYKVYGCFCSPECAVAYLMNENIDSSVKFERYSLINNLYGKIFESTQNIKPAPNPYYLLDKYYGNMTIQEYRTLLKSDRLFLVIDKPITKVLPEIHEDNTDFIISNKIIPSNTYQLKKRIQQKQNKTNILNENFGLSSK